MHELKIPEEVKKIVTLFQENGFEIYIVGGAIRDLLMNKPVTDWDYTTNARPEDMMNFLPNAFYDNQFGTVGVPSEEGLDPHEITTYRTEREYSDNRHPDVIAWGTTVEEDLERRDFTINAMALEIKNGQRIIDLFGGQKDIETKKIKAVGDPNERFKEDALRLMRAIRIATQLGFTIETKTQEAIEKNALRITNIAYERIREELLKILSSNYPAEGIELLRKTGLLIQILPELEKTFGVEQKSPNRHHIYDVGTHLVMALKNCKSTDPIVRFATLIHDIGKPRRRVHCSWQEETILT
jgi:tRNA nucleotidyltransferase/poly(A) polymerase